MMIRFRGLVGSCIYLAIAVAFGVVGSVGAAEDGPAPTIRIMSFNMWLGGVAGGQSLEQSATLVRASKADIVGLQEIEAKSGEGKPGIDNGARLAELLGWHFLDQGGRTAVISRFPITASTPNKWGVQVALPGGKNLYLFNAHFPASPYQPYQLLKIPYGKGRFIETAEQAILEADEARGAPLRRMLSELRSIDSEIPLFVTGDFNEPSHLDWTPAAAAEGACPLAVAWPTTSAVCDAGFLDSYRQVHPDPLKRNAFTWTPSTPPDDPKDRHDRIDFVFHSPHSTAKSAKIVGESTANADIVIDPYPSDHRAVVVEFQLAK